MVVAKVADDAVLVLTYFDDEPVVEVFGNKEACTRYVNDNSLTYYEIHNRLVNR
jgi:hypothetical protein